MKNTLALVLIVFGIVDFAEDPYMDAILKKL